MISHKRPTVESTSKRVGSSALLCLLALLVFSCQDKAKTYYEIDGDQVFYRSVERKSQFYYTATHHRSLVKGADASSFRKLNWKYGKDANYVYFEGRQSNKDLATFKLLSDYVAVDKNGAYSKDKLIQGSDGESFEVLNRYYAKDINQAYYSTSKDYFSIKGADPESFEAIETTITQYDYAKDAKRVYFEGKVLKEADPNTFETLGFEYSKDANTVYHNAKQISSNPNQFYIYKLSYATDHEKVFYRGSILPNANPDKFVIISHGYSKDDQTVYYDAKPINVDYASFVVESNLKKGYTSKDKNNFYVGPRIVEPK